MVTFSPTGLLKLLHIVMAFIAQETVTPGLCLHMSLSTPSPDSPVLGLETLYKLVFKGHAFPFTPYTGSGIFYWAQAWRDEDGQPHTDGTQRFPEKDRECSKDGLRFGKA